MLVFDQFCSIYYQTKLHYGSNYEVLEADIALVCDYDFLYLP